uniref:Anaphase-promoting complex subunit 10 n=1 Tax=Ditylenchus dipsaci TaxID=166011 RepID=A0A915CRS7_9BILA
MNDSGTYSAKENSQDWSVACLLMLVMSTIFQKKLSGSFFLQSRRIWHTPTAGRSNGHVLAERWTSTAFSDYRISTKDGHFFLVMYLDFKADESYTPCKIQVQTGSSILDLDDPTILTFNEPVGWQLIDVRSEGQPVRALLSSSRSCKTTRMDETHMSEVSRFSVQANLIWISIKEHWQEIRCWESTLQIRYLFRTLSHIRSFVSSALLLPNSSSVCTHDQVNKLFV